MRISDREPAAGAQPGWSEEVSGGERFRFGENWARFLTLLDDDRVHAAEESLAEMLGARSLEGMTFLDLGSGSGLFSLAARRMGARVHSVDYDPDSLECTRMLRERYFAGDPAWTVERGSVLDEAFMKGLGTFDVVYSWGVLHHTGEMWRAMENAVARVRPGGRLFVSIYNHQGWVSRYWTTVKRLYNRGGVLRAPVVLVHLPYLWGARSAVRALTRRSKLERGMSVWHDMIDWLGGYPFEAARPEDVVHFGTERGFLLRRMKTCGGRHGCNEFVFERA